MLRPGIGEVLCTIPGLHPILRGHFVRTIVLAVACVAGLASHGEEPRRDKNVVVEPHSGDGGGKSMAILIGVQDYDSLPKLEFCRADVRLLAKTLKENCQVETVLVMTEDAAESRFRPTLGNISRELRNWLRVANSGEYARVLVYFSGHGFRDAKNRLYFAPPDCDRENLELTALPQALVKQWLDVCTRVKVKLLILDCCHAGEGRGDGVGASGDAFAAVFREAKGLLTMASCRDEEISLESKDKQHGLFTYWLCEGLKGAADRDKDGQIDSDELHRFVFANVLRSSAEMARVQTVVLRPSEDWQGVAVLSRVRQPAGGAMPASLPPRSFDGNLAGTTWSVSDSDGDKHVFSFQADGALHYQSPRASSKSAQWTKSGDAVTININEQTAILEGTIHGATMSGKGTSKNGQSWTWQAALQ